MKFDLTPSIRRLLISIGIWCFAVGAAMATDWYLFNNLSNRANSMTQAREAVALMELKRSTLIKERNRLDDISADIETINSAFVDFSNPLKFIQKMENLARTSNVVLKLNLPQKRTNTLIIKAEAEGRAADILAFIRGVERLPEQAVFENLAFDNTSIGRARMSTQMEFLAR